MQSLLDILAPDVVALSDGGGVKQTMLRPIVGADRVARLFAAGLDVVGAEMSVEPVQVNGCSALIMRLNGDRQRRGGAGRGRLRHRPLLRAQSREAVACGAGDCCEPLSPGALSAADLRTGRRCGESAVGRPPARQRVLFHTLEDRFGLVNIITAEAILALADELMNRFAGIGMAERVVGKATTLLGWSHSDNSSSESASRKPEVQKP